MLSVASLLWPFEGISVIHGTSVQRLSEFIIDCLKHYGNFKIHGSFFHQLTFQIHDSCMHSYIPAACSAELTLIINRYILILD